MKGMPFPFEDFQGKGSLDFCAFSPLWPTRTGGGDDTCCYVVEPRSVLHLSRQRSPPTSSSTLSSSQTPAAACSNSSNHATPPVSAPPSLLQGHPHGIEDLDSILAVVGLSPPQEHSILGVITSEMDDNYKLGVSLTCPNIIDFNNAADQVFNSEQSLSFTNANVNSASPSPGTLISQLHNAGIYLPDHRAVEDAKLQMFSNFPHNSPVLPDPHLLLSPPPPKRLHSTTVQGDEGGNGKSHQFQVVQTIINPICQAAEMIESGNPVLAQGILARLNHHLSLPVGKPALRAAFYFKEALQLLLHLVSANSLSSLPPYNLIYKLGAYKSFSEISPILQFSNFTCNQALLEAVEGHDMIHIIDFDLAYGGQWASFMQELAMRGGDCPSLRITAFASPSSQDELELAFTRENLKLFAAEMNMPFEVEVRNLDCISLGQWPAMTEKEVIAVNLPMVSLWNNATPLPHLLRFVKHLSPNIVVSLDRGCDRSDLPFAHHINLAIQSYSLLLESLDAVNMSPNSLQRIERFLVKPGIEKMVVGRRRFPDRTSSWRTLFMQYGFAPVCFSSVTESQAECLLQRCAVRGFHVEKRHSSLVLFWQKKELITASAWKC